MRLQYTPHGEPGRDTAVRRRLAAERSADHSVQYSRDDRPHGRLESEATRGHACHRPDDSDAEPQPPGAGSCDRACSAPRRAHQGDETHIQGKKSPGGRASALDPGAGARAPRGGDEELGRRATASGVLVSCRRLAIGAAPGTAEWPARLSIWMAPGG